MSDTQNDPHGSRGSILDAAIDRAVRQMVQREPAAGLRRRVEARITTAGVRSAPPVFRYLAAAAAVALLVLAVALRRDHSAEPRNGLRDVRLASEARDATGSRTPLQGLPASTAAESTAASPRQSAARDPAARRQDTPRQPAGKRAHADVIPMPAIHNVFGEAGETVAGATVAAGKEVGAAAVVLPAADAMAVPELSVPPLHVEPLRIAPIGPPKRGHSSLR